MTFTNIALKNIQKKLSSYFISTTFSVAIFNLFCAIYYNPAFETYRFGAGKMSALFRSSAIAIFLFAAIFVLYSNSYFIKTQKKVIAIYSLLGMRKAQIALMMFLETFFIGAFAIICGVFIGTCSSGYFTSLLMRFMAISTSVTLSATPTALLVTLIAFVILFIISGINAYKPIYRYSLHHLLSATKQSEGIPSFSLLGALISLIFLASGYVLSIVMNVKVSGLHLLAPMLIGIICISLGTFLLYRNVIPMAIAALKKRKPFYYQTANFLSISQITFRLKANSSMLSIITLLTAITITMISASCSFYSILSGDATKCYAPFSYLAKNITKAQHDKILKTISNLNDVSVASEDKIDLIHIAIQNNQYAIKDQQTGEAVPGQIVNAYLLSQSMYLKIISETQTPKGNYSETRTNFTGGLDDNTCYFIDGNAISDYCKHLLGQKINVAFHTKKSTYTVSGSALHKYIGALDLYKYPTLVVSDAIYESYHAQSNASDIDIFYGFQFNDNMNSERTVNAINQFIPARFHIGSLPGNMSYISMYKANFALFGSYTFIGFFLGTLFLLASSSIMYYKLIIEAQEEAPRYAILRKIGMKKSEIIFSITKQLGLIYGIPLFIGLIHTLFGLFFYNRTLGEVGQQMPTLQNALMVVLVFIIVYSAFYTLSIKSYYRIVWQQANE